MFQTAPYFLALRQCYITEMQQFDDVLTGRFFTRVGFYGDAENTPPTTQGTNARSTDSIGGRRNRRIP